MKTKVIYIVGSAHSGSTLLDLILGSHSRIESVGEVNERVGQILSGALATLDPIDQACTCGAKFLDCPHWTPIFDRIRSRGMRERDFLQNPLLAKRDNEIFVEEVLRQSCKQVYLESTKSIERLTQFRQSPSFDLYVLHIVRDGRAVAYSNVRKGRELYTYAARWINKNLALLEHRNAFLGRWMTIKYERLVTRPAEEIRQIMNFVEEEFEEGQLDYARAIHHNIDGNFMRLGAVSEIVADTRYLSGLRPMQWAMVTTYAFNALTRFGYPLSKRQTRSLFDS
ncbi:MAG: sulfotransferase [Xanthobacteraceae bacterium]